MSPPSACTSYIALETATSLYLGQFPASKDVQHNLWVQSPAADQDEALQLVKFPTVRDLDSTGRLNAMFPLTGRTIIPT